MDEQQPPDKKLPIADKDEFELALRSFIATEKG